MPKERKESMPNKTRKQHYVQDALITNWEKNGSVGVAKKIDNAYLKKERSKSPSSIFFEEYGYEVLHGFDSMKKHAENDFSTSFDPEHPLKINDGERYCKYIEDAGLPIIRKIINSTENMIEISCEEKSSLCRYLILQSIRTPQGRKNYLPEYPNVRISPLSSDKETFSQFIGNIMYLMILGVYDENGVSNDIDMSTSVFKRFCSLFEDMNGYVVRIKEGSKDQFIVGDNPCIIIGEKTVWGVMMPLSPKNMLILVGEKPERRNGFAVVKCSKRLKLFELCSQFYASNEKIVFSEKYCSINRINRDIYNGRRFIGAKQPIWQLYKDSGNEDNIEPFEKLLKDFNHLFY